MPTAELLRLAEILDKAGFAYLEVSGGGVFDTAVRRGVESPWERIRALNERTETPLAMALRGRFLVGSRPVGGEFVSRFVASAAESGIEVFRLHDPLNDVENLREAGEAITNAGKEFDAGLVFGSGYTNETEALVEQAKKLPELGAARVLLHDPSSSLQPHRAQELVETLKEASGLPVGLYCQGAGGNAMAAGLDAARAGADLIACAVYPVALTVHRISGEALATALAGLGLDTGVDVAALWRGAGPLRGGLRQRPAGAGGGGGWGGGGTPRAAAGGRGRFRRWRREARGARRGAASRGGWGPRSPRTGARPAPARGSARCPTSSRRFGRRSASRRSP